MSFPLPVLIVLTFMLLLLLPLPLLASVLLLLLFVFVMFKPLVLVSLGLLLLKHLVDEASEPPLAEDFLLSASFTLGSTKLNWMLLLPPPPGLAVPTDSCQGHSRTSRYSSW